MSKSAIVAVDDDPAALNLARCAEQVVLVVRAAVALETSVPWVFAAGDIRLDSMKRVASAVGEGAMPVHFVHRYLATA